MQIHEKKENDMFILQPVGRLDSNTSQQFEDILFKAIQGDQNIIVDFERLDYISSAGLRVILKATREKKLGSGNIILCSMKDYVKEVFEIAGFDTIFTIVQSLDDTKEAIKHGS